MARRRGGGKAAGAARQSATSDCGGYRAALRRSSPIKHPPMKVPTWMARMPQRCLFCSQMGGRCKWHRQAVVALQCMPR